MKQEGLNMNREVNRFFYKFFSKVLFFSSIFIFILFSVSICLLCFELLSNYTFLFDYRGMLKLIQVFSPLNNIAASCFALIAIFLVVIQIELSVEANIFNSKSFWIEKMMIEIENLKSENPIIHRYFRVYGDEIFDYLYTINMRFSNKAQLEYFYTSYFKGKVPSFEEGAKIYDKSYPENVSFSNSQIDGIKDLLLKYSPEYPSNIKMDFNDMYNKEFIEYRKTLA